MWKQTVDNFINVEWCSLNTISKSITKWNYDSGDLLSELVIYLYDNEDKLLYYYNNNLMKGFCVTWMKTQIQHKTSTFRRKYVKNGGEYLENHPMDLPNNDFEKDDWEKDMSNIFTDEQIEMVKKIYECYPLLTEAQKVLFKAHFIEGLSYDSIRKKYTFFREKDGKKVYYKSKKSIYNLMMTLKEKIKENL